MSRPDGAGPMRPRTSPEPSIGERAQAAGVASRDAGPESKRRGYAGLEALGVSPRNPHKNWTSFAVCSGSLTSAIKKVAPPGAVR